MGSARAEDDRRAVLELDLVPLRPEPAPVLGVGDHVGLTGRIQMDLNHLHVALVAPEVEEARIVVVHEEPVLQPGVARFLDDASVHLVRVAGQAMHLVRRRHIVGGLADEVSGERGLARGIRVGSQEVEGQRRHRTAARCSGHREHGAVDALERVAGVVGDDRRRVGVVRLERVVLHEWPVLRQ